MITQLSNVNFGKTTNVLEATTKSFQPAFSGLKLKDHQPAKDMCCFKGATKWPIVNGYKIMPGADLSYANLKGANLQEKDLEDAKLQWANLQDADLQGADLRGADLYRAELEDADLQNAKLIDADLRGAKLEGATLTGVILNSYTLNTITDERSKEYIRNNYRLISNSEKSTIVIMPKAFQELKI